MGSDFKYLLAYIIPIFTGLSIYLGGIWSISIIIIAFVLIPIFEQILPSSEENLNEEESERRLNMRFFDFLMYSHLPILYVLLFWFYYQVGQGAYTSLELIGLTASLGLLAGSFGINIAHELGHRNNKGDQLISKLLLIPSLYMHFFIEHNRGHHLHVATHKDPATSRMGEPIYRFYFRTIIYSYLSAWNIQKKTLKQQKKSFWSLENEMLIFHVVQLIYLTAVFSIFGLLTFFVALAVALGGLLTLETVNYIEHYGLKRKQLASGKYERVQPKHSWNSNHELGRIFLYELSRHSDHHYKSNRKFQVLRHMEESPQLPYGYPASMLMALIPPLWFKVMNKRAAAWSGE